MSISFLHQKMLEKIDGDAEWEQRYGQNLKWFRSQTDAYASQGMRLIIVFAHNKQAREVFRFIRGFSGCPVLYIQGNGHVFKVREKKRLNFAWLQVDRGGFAPPLKITIAGNDTEADVSKAADLELLSGLVQVRRGLGII